MKQTRICSCSACASDQSSAKTISLFWTPESESTPSMSAQESQVLEQPSSEDVRIPVEGMTCAACALRIERKLGKLEGISEAGVNYAAEEAVVTLQSGGPDLSEIVHVIRKTGYDVKTSLAEVRFEGEEATDSAQDLVASLDVLNGITDVDLSSRGEGMDVAIQYIPAMISGRRLTEHVNRFRPSDTHSGPTAAEEARVQERKMRTRLVVSVVFSVPLAVIAMSHGAFGLPYEHWIQLALAVPVVLYAGTPFFSSAWTALRHGGTDMNTLVALGVGSAFLYSTFALFFPDLVLADGIPPVYFEAAALIVTFILVGRYLEERAKSRTGEAIDRLRELQPDEARVLRDGDVALIPTEDIVLGDVVRVLPGERIPVDGQVLEGESPVDEAMVTGESVPVLKGPGSSVVAGTTNTTGVLTIEVSRIGPDTMLAQITHLVSKAQATKAPVQQLADRVAAVFVPIVLVIATVAALVWWGWGPDPSLDHALLRFVSVLIIACPCALGLATPTAIVVGTGRAAKRGILIRDASALQMLASVGVVAFDKTGTITKGELVVSRWHAEGADGEDALIAAAASLEQVSEHPIGKAIQAAATKRELLLMEPKDVTVIPGKGIAGSVGGKRVTVGNAVFLEGEGIHIPAIPDDLTGSVVFVSREDAFLGWLEVSDEPREEAEVTLSRIASMGLESVLLTGDREEAASHIAAQVGLTTWKAGLLPDEKVTNVEALKRQGKRVAMVGDGINDAPALAAADLGIAVHSGTDVAREASDITLMKHDLALIPEAVELSKETMQIIRQNLFFAFVYNVICIPIAAGALYPAFGILLSPIIASAAMALSSVSVVTNSLRLKGR